MNGIWVKLGCALLKTPNHHLTPAIPSENHVNKCILQLLLNATGEHTTNNMCVELGLSHLHEIPDMQQDTPYTH